MEQRFGPLVRPRRSQVRQGRPDKGERVMRRAACLSDNSARLLEIPTLLRCCWQLPKAHDQLDVVGKIVKPGGVR